MQVLDVDVHCSYEAGMFWKDLLQNPIEVPHVTRSWKFHTCHWAISCHQYLQQGERKERKGFKYWHGYLEEVNADKAWDCLLNTNVNRLWRYQLFFNEKTWRLFIQPVILHKNTTRTKAQTVSIVTGGHHTTHPSYKKERKGNFSYVSVEVTWINRCSIQNFRSFLQGVCF